MIYYKSGGIHIFLKLFYLKGSNFPITCLVALPSAILSAVLHWLFPEGSLRLQVFGALGEDTGGVVSESQAWAGFSFLVGFLIVFRTSQAYGRFWEGCTASHTMRAEWFDACSSLVSFCKCSCAPAQEVWRFKHLLIRLTSMLHAAALAELESGDSNSASFFARDYEMIDPGGVDRKSLETLINTQARVELIFEWIQQLIVENIETGVLSIPPPILSRSFQELANGMVAFHDAMKISYIPFPFPYAQSCDCLLIFHWLLVPVVTSQWVSHSVWAAVFSFIQVFILWSLNLIAIEIDNPFGKDMNDIDATKMQEEINTHLGLLVTPTTERTPRLTKSCTMFQDKTGGGGITMRKVKSSFSELLNEPQKYNFEEVANDCYDDHHERISEQHSSLMSGLSSTHTAATSSGAMSVIVNPTVAEADIMEVVEALAVNMQHATRGDEHDMDEGNGTLDAAPFPWGARDRRSANNNRALNLRPELAVPSKKKPSPKPKPRGLHQCPSCSHDIECGRFPGSESVGDTPCALCQSCTNSAEHACAQCQKSFCRACIRLRQPERALSRATLSSGASTTAGRASPLQPQLGEDSSPIPDDAQVAQFLRASTLESLRNPSSADTALREAIDGNGDARAAADSFEEEGVWT